MIERQLRIDIEAHLRGEVLRARTHIEQLQREITQEAHNLNVTKQLLGKLPPVPPVEWNRP